MENRKKVFVVVTHDPHKTAHFDKVVSVLFEGSYIDCEEYLANHVGYITLASNIKGAK